MSKTPPKWHIASSQLRHAATHEHKIVILIKDIVPQLRDSNKHINGVWALSSQLTPATSSSGPPSVRGSRASPSPVRSNRWHLKIEPRSSHHTQLMPSGGAAHTYEIPTNHQQWNFLSVTLTLAVCSFFYIMFCNSACTRCRNSNIFMYQK